jgi:hypothetical protein
MPRSIRRNEMAHTPGPWFVNNQTDIMDRKFETFVGVSFRASEEERLSNAKLIAVAPEALATLKALVAWWHDTNSVRAIQEAKALGYPHVIARALKVIEDAS